MKQNKIANNMRIIASLIAVIMLCVFFTACQPTPEVSAVVGKKEDVLKNAIKESGGEIDQTAYLEPVTYEVVDHWKENIQKSDLFTIEADIDVLKPTAKKYPIEKVESLDMSQELADRLIYTFVKEGTKFFVYPEPKTKADYEAEILQMKKTISEVEAGGDGEDPDFLRENIKEAEKKMAEAPETVERQYIEAVFDYPRDFETGKPDKDYGQNSIQLAIEGENGEEAGSIYVQKHDPQDLYSSSSSFYYSQNVEHYTLAFYEEQLRYMEQSQKWIDQIPEDNPYRAEQIEQQEKQKQELETIKAKLDENNIDIEPLKQKGLELLEKLGISDIQIISCEKAVIGKVEDTGNFWNPNYEYKEPTLDQKGCAINFSRECGGIPCQIEYWSSGNEDKLQDYYSAPFYTESGSILLAEDGSVLSFDWNSGAKTVEQVAGDTELLPFEEVKKRIADKIYYDGTSYYDEEYTQEMSQEKKRCVIEEVKLSMTYINAKDDAEHALVVPVWVAKVQEYSTYLNMENTGSEQEQMGNQNFVLINALDGGFVASPMLERNKEMYQREMEKWQKENPDDGGAVAIPVG